MVLLAVFLPVGIQASNAAMSTLSTGLNSNGRRMERAIANRVTEYGSMEGRSGQPPVGNQLWVKGLVQ